MSRRYKKILFFLFLLFFFFKCFVCFGGELSFDVASKLKMAKADEYVSCLVMMKDQANTSMVNAKLNPALATRKQMHASVLSALKDKSESSQMELVDYLNQKITDGGVKQFKTFWITNAILVTAKKEVIEKIALRPEVEVVEENYPITLTEPVSVEKAAGGAVEKERCLSAMSVREAWKMGYNGAGRLVCSLDTGVDGHHPALESNWRGNNGGSASACWFDPLGSTYPKDDKGHGSHTMGIMVGKSDDDTIGVAYGAEWIAAAVIDRGQTFSQTVADILDAFQWAVDPDENPETIDDVPDVINNSWGIPVGFKPACDQTFWNAIDNTENAGVVVIFAAGNEGPNPSTLRTPADRISSPTNSFSVGAVDAQSYGYPVANFSSRGPSGCDNQTIKPEVCAPGVNVYSCYKNGEYRLMSGTSMSAPFVSGAVAILRQYNPDATTEQVKQALLESCTDLGSPGEDNSYGWGMINVKRALEILPKPNRPNLYLVDFHINEGNIPQPGDLVNLVVDLKNSGSTVSGVSGVLSSSDSLVQLPSNSLFFGSVESDEEVSNSDSPLQVKFSQNVPSGRKVELLLHLSGQAPSYDADIKFTITVGNLPPFSLGEQNAGNFLFTLSNFGQYGLGDGSFNPLGGKGFRYPRDGKDNLYEAAFLMGTSPDQVSDGARGEDGKSPCQDFEALPGGELVMQSSGDIADQESYCKFSDRRAINPLGLEIIQRSFAYADPVNDDYLILQYTIKNVNSHPVNGLYAGLFFDWDISLGSAGDDQIGWDSAQGVYYQFDPQSQIYLCLLPLVNRNYFAYQIDNPGWLYDGFSKQEKYEFLSGSAPQTTSQALSASGAKDWSQMVSIGPFSLASQESTVVAFAVVAGTSLNELTINLYSARAKYDGICTGVEEDKDKPNLPSHFVLSQNYPNPFNPVTTIAFELKPENSAPSVSPSSGPNDESLKSQVGQFSNVPVSLRIYNIQGELVKTLLEESLPPGRYQLTWDGTDQTGEKVASGVYLYNLRTPQSQTSKKMILLK
jgi:subtilisin family serine protease